jgi:hypothetical protein
VNGNQTGGDIDMASHETARQALEQRELWLLLGSLIGAECIAAGVALVLAWRRLHWTWAFAGLPLAWGLTFVDPWLALLCGVATTIAVLFGLLVWVTGHSEDAAIPREAQSSSEGDDPFLLSPSGRNPDG